MINSRTFARWRREKERRHIYFIIIFPFSSRVILLKRVPYLRGIDRTLLIRNKFTRGYITRLDDYLWIPVYIRVIRSSLACIRIQARSEAATINYVHVPLRYRFVFIRVREIYIQARDRAIRNRLCDAFQDEESIVNIAVFVVPRPLLLLFFFFCILCATLFRMERLNTRH